MCHIREAKLLRIEWCESLSAYVEVWQERGEKIRDQTRGERAIRPGNLYYKMGLS
jgi:hypothetical protein